MEKDDGVTRADVVLNGPLNSICALFAEIDGDCNTTLRGGGWRGGRGGCFHLDWRDVADVFRSHWWIRDGNIIIVIMISNST